MCSLFICDFVGFSPPQTSWSKCCDVSTQTGLWMSPEQRCDHAGEGVITCVGRPLPHLDLIVVRIIIVQHVFLSLTSCFVLCLGVEDVWILLVAFLLRYFSLLAFWIFPDDSCRYKNSLSVVPPAGLSVIITGRQTKKPNNVLKCISINVIRVNSPLPRSHNPLGCHTKSFQAFFLFALSLTCFVFESQKSVRRMFKISSSIFLRTAGSIVDRRWQKVFFYSGWMDLC